MGKVIDMATRREMPTLPPGVKVGTKDEKLAGRDAAKVRAESAAKAPAKVRREEKSTNTKKEKVMKTNAAKKTQATKHAATTKAQPSLGREGSTGRFIREHILKGGSNKAIFAAALKAKRLGKEMAWVVGWYRAQMVRVGWKRTQVYPKSAEA